MLSKLVQSSNKKIPTSLFAQLFILLTTFASSAVTANPPAKLDELMTPVNAATYDRLYQNNAFAITPFNDLKFKIFAGHKVNPSNQMTQSWDGQALPKLPR